MWFYGENGNKKHVNVNTTHTNVKIWSCDQCEELSNVNKTSKQCEHGCA